MPFVLLYLVVEILALVAVGSVIGVGWTLVLLLAAAVLGVWLARREGVRALQAIGEAVANRRMPAAELTDGLLVAVGGLLFLIPGLVTDLAGLLLVLPPTRSFIRRRVLRAAEQRTGLRTVHIHGGEIVEGEVVDDGRGSGPGTGRAVEGPGRATDDGLAPPDARAS
ncbi:UPF0716 protein FxsA [Pseudonocardia thermophila]|jgi:Protein affecting phage T7 exclusion by the F plasmid|uniref:UPF0716 protein FxsA n=1 Tax=Pseudonocardia thermophila TaxID=1848 RepID=A0A1M7ARB6_PSETH|nr:FxsA family protein [Pseudonocardia thermophila]SHL44929.1 UPF0716 protein FxsA [Pseudonocardia thermophila]